MVRRSQKKIAREGVASASGTSWLHSDWPWTVVLFASIILAYTPVWWAGFVWDDDGVLTANPVIVGPLGLKEIWTTSAADICPLTLTTFWLEHKLWALAAWPYHLVNVLFHAASAIVLWRVLSALNIPGAWIGAALWALHPVMVESVAWVTEMKNTESGLFFLLTIWFWVRDLREDDSAKGNYALMLLFAVLAMAAKTSTVTLPLVLSLCVWWMKGKLAWRHLVKIAPLFAFSFLASVLTIWTQMGLRIQDPQIPLNLPQRVAASGDAICFYLGKLVWPHPLITVYPRWQIDPGQWFSYLPLLIVIALGVSLWRMRNTWARPCFFAFAYFLVVLLPVLGLVYNSYSRYSLVADHFQYLASIGPLALLGALLFKFTHCLPPKKTLLQAVGAGLFLVLGMTSWSQAWVYQDQEKLWCHTLRWNSESWEGHNNLGNIILDRGQIDEAIQHYNAALKAAPDFPKPHYNLGVALARKGQISQAMEQYQIAVEIDPNYAKAQYQLGLILVDRGRIPEAIGCYQRALTITPNDPQIYFHLGHALGYTGQKEDAMICFKNAIILKPDFAEAHASLGLALAQTGRIDEALQELQKAVELNPVYPEAHNNLGIALAMKGNVTEAMNHFQEALRLRPNFTDAQKNLAKAKMDANR